MSNKFAGDGFLNFLLAAITETRATLPDGTAGTPLVNHYADYEANGRVTRMFRLRI